MKKLIDVRGKRVGLLVVNDKPHLRKNNVTFWECTCDCGNVKYIRSQRLVSGDLKSCGCYYKHLKPYESLYNKFKGRTLRAKKHDVKLTYEEFLEFTKVKKCHYCNADIKWTECNTCYNGEVYNLDRKDNKIGYTKENCLVCCSTCNYMKRTSNYQNFIIQCRRIVRNMKKKGNLWKSLEEFKKSLQEK